jgi:hypothetical protein
MSVSLNDTCPCRSVEEEALRDALSPEVFDGIAKDQPHLFSPVPFFVSTEQERAMRQAVTSIEKVIATRAWQERVLKNAPEIAHFDSHALGVFFGYDFHLSDEGPKLIEINTNAGGAFLNIALGKAQRACCDDMRPAMATFDVPLAADFAEMFRTVWSAVRGETALRRVAIVDHEPRAQYLYPEFVIAAKALAKAGLETVVADISALTIEGDRLCVEGKPVDLVYNRSTDFYFAEPSSAALRDAYLRDLAVVTPHPRAHALYANKANLVALSSSQWLETLDEVDASTRERVLAAVPLTRRVSRDDANALWAERKTLFFKPLHGFGSKAAYRGDKLTKGVYASILEGEYVAQALVPPSARTVHEQGKDSRVLKADIRAYVFKGEVQLFAARLYHGQTTNFRTEGGGFASVFHAPSA